MGREPAASQRPDETGRTVMTTPHRAPAAARVIGAGLRPAGGRVDEVLDPEVNTSASSPIGRRYWPSLAEKPLTR